jgi:uncharacterized damage-inducible protein DinB
MSAMDADYARRLYAYNDWANERILTVIAKLPPEEYTRNIVSSYSSIRETLAHIAFAEWLWLQRWKGMSPAGPPEWVSAVAFDDLARQIRAVAAERRDYLAQLESAAKALSYRSTEGDPFTMALPDLLTHCANHSTYHRGQLVTMLRQVGATPPNMDYTRFARSVAQG